MTYETSAVRQDPEFKNFSATPVGGTLGANIEGLDISQPLSTEAAIEIQQLSSMLATDFINRNVFLLP